MAKSKMFSDMQVSISTLTQREKKSMEYISSLIEQNLIRYMQHGKKQNVLRYASFNFNPDQKKEKIYGIHLKSHRAKFNKIYATWQKAKCSQICKFQFQP